MSLEDIHLIILWADAIRYGFALDCGREIVTVDAVAASAMFQHRADQVMRKSRFVRFSLRTALILLTLLCVALGWWVVKARQQREAVAAVRELGGHAHYTFEVGPEGFLQKRSKPPSAPAWLRDTFGEDLFIMRDTVIFKGIRDDFVEQVVPKLRPVSSIRSLELRDTLISDAALRASPS